MADLVWFGPNGHQHYTIEGYFDRQKPTMNEYAVVESPIKPDLIPWLNGLREFMGMSLFVGIPPFFHQCDTDIFVCVLSIRGFRANFTDRRIALLQAVTDHCSYDAVIRHDIHYLPDGPDRKCRYRYGPCDMDALVRCIVGKTKWLCLLWVMAQGLQTYVSIVITILRMIIFNMNRLDGILNALFADH